MAQNKDINKTALNSLYEYSRQDLCDYNNGELTISPNAVSLMKDFINILRNLSDFVFACMDFSN